MDIVVIGSGNIATHLAKSFNVLNHDIIQVYSKDIANARALAISFPASAIDQLKAINQNAALYVIAVSDAAITDVVEQLPNDLQGLVIHTSGATPMSVLQKFEHHGVIYPAQSLIKNVESSHTQVPFGVEGNSPQTTERLLELMQKVSLKTFTCDSVQRLALHTAAVFANNFTNVLFRIAYDILQAQDLPFELLKPLIMETAKKVQEHHPSQVQTGPAVRNDNQTIDRHLQFLSKNPNWVKIYQQLTKEIINGNSN